MISLCVFSKDRPMQLDAFFQSLKNAPYVTDVSVLYTTSADHFEYGYSILREAYPTYQFLREDDFCEDVENIVADSNEYFMWATDDSLFYRKVDLTQEKLAWTFGKQGALALNLRMGLNIKWQNHWKADLSARINVLQKHQDLICWNAAQYSVNTDVGRVWQNDASIMQRDKYLKAMREEDGWKFNKSRSLDTLANSGRKFDPCIMASFDNSVYVNVPVNLVHVLADGRLYADNWGKYHRFSTESLNEKFLDGYRIDVDDAINVHCENLDCGRKEIPYVFVQHDCDEA